MDHRIPRVGVVISVILAIGALITFVFLNGRFQGPNPVGFLSSPYELKARFKDNKTLPTKQPVLYHGITVGTITKVHWDAAAKESEVTFTLNDDFRLKDDASIRIGYRSLLGDPYLAVDSRGTAGHPEMKSGDEVKDTSTTVDFDEALAFLDAEGRKHVKSLIQTVADGTVAPGNGERLNGTLSGVARSVHELHVLTKTLHGQERDIADLVRTSGVVLSTLGSREDSIRTIVSSGRTTLDGLAANTASLQQGLDELPRVLASGRASLRDLRPLFTESQPVFRKLGAVAPSLTTALDPNAKYPLNKAVTNLVAIIKDLGPLNKQAIPVLKRLKTLLEVLDDVVRAGAPGARNLVPALAYLQPRSKAIATGYALLAAAQHTDAKGQYIRVGLGLEPGESTDGADAGGKNAYPGEGDALNPKPFTGTYPRIVPCTVPSRKTPTLPCK